MSGLEPLAYNDGNVRLTGWLARPEGQPRAAVVAYPTIANLTPRVAEKARVLAEEGFLVLVADYYGVAIESFEQSLPLAQALRADPAAYHRRLSATLEALAALPEGTGLTTFAIGFCMGGQAALEMARAGKDVAAVASFHGLLDTALPASADRPIHSRILVCHGDKDPMVPRDQVRAFMEEMDAAGADWRLHVYGSARHGFTDPASDSRPLEAVAYDASADRQSWAAMLDFFEETLSSR